MKSVKALGLIAGLMLVLMPVPSWAQNFQRVPFASAPNPVGSGARAIAWGGSFIAVSDDATAASWNPAGLVQLITPEASVAMSYHTRTDEFNFSAGGYDISSESHVTTMANLNYASVVYPFNVSEINMVASVNYQRMFEFDRNLSYTSSGLNTLGYQFTETQELQQSGALTTLTPAFAVQITPAWSMGVAVNFWGLDGAGDGWEQQWQVDYRGVKPGDPSTLGLSLYETKETYELSGVNYVIGTHVKVQSLTIGLVYKSAWVADVDYTNSYEYAQMFPNAPIGNSKGLIKTEQDQELTWPESYGIGLAWRYSDEFSIAADAYTTRWSQFNLKTDEGDLNLLAGEDQSVEIQDTWQFRVGGEYLWVLPKYVVAARGGFFFDPEPISDEVNNFYGAALGGGFGYQNFVVDAAVQYRWGADAKWEKVQGAQATTDTSEVMGIVSLIYHFE